jgi:hypothetical protein
MPKLDKMFTLEVTPEQFLRNCSNTELIETDLLLQSKFYQMRMTGTNSHGVDSKAKELTLIKTEE